MTRPMSLMMDGWMPSVGSSSTSKRGFITNARPMASCCCWPPDRSPPRRRNMVFRIGNSAKISSGSLRSRRGNTAKPVSRFSRTVSNGKMSRPCGTQAMPRLARSKVGSRGDVTAFPRDAAGADRVGAGDGAQQAGLSHAVAPQHGGDRAGLRRDRDAAEGDGRAVVQVHVGDGQHGGAASSVGRARGADARWSASKVDLHHVGIGADMVDGAFTQGRSPRAGTSPSRPGTARTPCRAPPPPRCGSG